jgi:murein tripeptide amidase MpaA
MAYLDMVGINTAITFLGDTYPSLATVFPLPEPSRNGSTMRGYRLGAGSRGDRRAVLALGGVHARELVNPDMLISLSIKLCQAYTDGTGLDFGGTSFAATDIKLVLDALDVYVIPVVNPDGREFVQSPSGMPMWRKNRALIPGSSCIGVDLNRNADFLWPFAIGQTSTQPCSDTFHGTSAFSEPEERNVRWMLDAHPTIRVVVDVHSYSELILYPWGDDTTQTSDTTQNFHNPAWDGQRGFSGGYAEYMPSDDKQRFEQTAIRVQQAIQGVRGRTYTAEPGFQLYGTSGTNSDYAYSRHLANTSAAKVYGFTIETGREFQPATAEASWVIKEGSAGVLRLLLQSICAIDVIGSGLLGAAAALDAEQLDGLTGLRDSVFVRSAVGRRLTVLLEEHSAELGRIALRRPAVAKRMAALLTELTPAALGREPISDVHVAHARSVGDAVAKLGSLELQSGIEEALTLAPQFEGVTVRAGLQAADRARRPRARTAGQARRGR